MNPATTPAATGPFPADDPTLPTGRECLLCYVARLLEAHGCDTTLRWSLRFRDARSPTATGLERRVGETGGSCDCTLLEGHRLARHLLVRDLATDELEAPAERPDCAAVRRTSTRPCANWERQRRPAGR